MHCMEQFLYAQFPILMLQNAMNSTLMETSLTEHCLEAFFRNCVKVCNTMATVFCVSLTVRSSVLAFVDILCHSVSLNLIT